jgi:hypothetical protein
MPDPCKRCWTEIPQERRGVLPETALCVACSEAVGGEWEYIGIEVNLGKAGSLKKNYGGLQILKLRRRILPNYLERRT